ncbi:hypothetical protein BEP19_08945 [Ammoniphilus oxalaticus]|uniref:Uncharacterized protein n=1 Tax=Ammoniphilus oxalaticus TaxID=66863 RepID=A0A419SKE0_9BACL|nr:hypothetical protein [Ammoniphilus oxalaticus]RKD24501.1 hypothetical protein BEP19_08945 [Ammoniphilus oxalaticus]
MGNEGRGANVRGAAALTGVETTTKGGSELIPMQREMRPLQEGAMQRIEESSRSNGSCDHYKGRIRINRDVAGDEAVTGESDAANEGDNRSNGS